MANAQTYPASLFPLQGDISAGAGDTSVEVTGLQEVPIAPQPYIDGAVPTFVLANSDIEWQVPVFTDADVNFISLQPGDVMVWNGSQWVNAGLPEILSLNLPVYANNASAIAGGLIAGNLYRTGADPDFVAVVH